MAMEMKQPKRKTCERCGKVMVQPRWSNGKLDSTFNQRRYCSRRCAATTGTKTMNSGRRAAQRMVLAKKCNRCPATTNLQRHHRDRNPRNNSGENVETLCQTCHKNDHMTDQTWGRGGEASRKTSGVSPPP